MNFPHFPMNVNSTQYFKNVSYVLLNDVIFHEFSSGCVKLYKKLLESGLRNVMKKFLLTTLDMNDIPLKLMGLKRL
jgi:hypothetical protein